jgi:hypothetical protein
MIQETTTFCCSGNIRRAFVEDDGPRPVLWVGSNHGASIVKVEPMD